jgi:hypothetical protein
MKPLKPFLYVALIACLWTAAGCTRNSAAVSESAGGASPESNVNDIEYGIKAKAMLKADVAGAKPLRFVHRIKSEMGGKGKLVYPVSLAVSDTGVAYLSDNNAHVIHSCPPNLDSIVTLPIQEGQGRLVWPNSIETWRDSLLVTDNEGIKFFKPDGAFQRLTRVFYQINYFAMRPDGAIYINPSFSKQKPDNPLIVELDSTGKRVKAFGARLNSPDRIGLSDQTYLSVTDKYIFAAFKHRPAIRVYNTDGELIREFGIDHPAFDDLAPLSRDERFIRPEPDKFRLPKYISGARVIGDRLLVLLDLPQPEIVEFNFEGQEQNRYRANVSPAVKTYRGFDIRRTGDAYHFWILCADDESSINLFEFIPSEGM